MSTNDSLKILLVSVIGNHKVAFNDAQYKNWVLNVRTNTLMVNTFCSENVVNWTF